MHYVALALIAFAAAVGAVPPVAVVAAPEVEIVVCSEYFLDIQLQSKIYYLKHQNLF